MAKIVVLATMAAVLQLAGALTEPDCPVMEGEMLLFTVTTELSILQDRIFLRDAGSRGGY